MHGEIEFLFRTAFLRKRGAHKTVRLMRSRERNLCQNRLIKLNELTSCFLQCLHLFAENRDDIFP